LDQIDCLEDLCQTLPRPWAVVGNGVARFKVGDVIDSYPTIVRFNEYVIDGYEEYVGTKITLRCVLWGPSTPRPTPAPLISPSIPKIESAEAWSVHQYNIAMGVNVIRPKKGLGITGFFATTGYALLKFLNREKIEATVFHMDGLQTGHYWETDHKHWEYHKGQHEWEEIKRMPYIQIYTHQFEQV